jgi:hypothetical protein
MVCGMCIPSFWNTHSNFVLCSIESATRGFHSYSSASGIRPVFSVKILSHVPFILYPFFFLGLCEDSTLTSQDFRSTDSVPTLRDRVKIGFLHLRNMVLDEENVLLTVNIEVRLLTVNQRSRPKNGNRHSTRFSTSSLALLISYTP